MFVTLKSALGASFVDMHMAVEDCGCLGEERGTTLPSCFSLQTINECPFYSPFGAMCFTFLCFWLVILRLGMAPEHSTRRL